MPFLTVFPGDGKLKSLRGPGVVPGSVSSARWARRRRRRFAPARCPRWQGKPPPSVRASRNRRMSWTGHCCPAQPKTDSFFLLTRRPHKARLFRSRRSAKEQEELKERVDHCVIAELGPFARRPTLQRRKSNASHTRPRILAAKNTNTTSKIFARFFIRPKA